LGECEIYLSKLVAEKEVRYYQGHEFDEVIDLSPAVNAGQLTIFKVGASEVQQFRERFDRECLSKLDDGEAESLTHMLSGQPGGWLFSSSDAIVFRVLGNLNTLAASPSRISLAGPSRTMATRASRSSMTPIWT
jgi:hypothetical protein